MIQGYHSGVVVEHQTLNREVLGLIGTGGTVLYVPEQLQYWLKPSKWWLHPDMTEKLLIGTLKSQTCRGKRSDCFLVPLTLQVNGIKVATGCDN